MLDRRLWREAQSSRFLLLLTVGLSAALGLATVAQAALLSRIIAGVFLENAGLQEVSRSLSLLLALLLLRAGLVWLGEVGAKAIALRVKRRLRNRLFAQLLALGPLEAQGERAGELLSTLVERIEALDAYFSQYLPQLFIALLVPLIIVAAVLPRDPLSGVIMLLTAPLIPFFMWLIGQASARLTARQWRSLSRMSAHFLDVLQGLTTLKQLGQSKSQVQNVARISERFREGTMRVLRVTFLSALALELLATLSVAIIAVQIGLRLLAGNMAFVNALFILILAPEFYMPLRALGARFHAGMDGSAAAERIFGLLEKRPSGPGSPPFSPVEATGSAPAITFSEVHYAYQEGQRPALHDVSFKIPAGERVALVGASGAGKSTVANLLLRFVEADAGQIVVDGRPLQQIEPSTWRQQLAWVPQLPYLFNDTVTANIRLGQPDASDEAVAEAARRARAHDFIQTLPQGYETVIGERGARLSAGQAQRLALARAFLQDAPLLILDEPTANLDLRTEALLQEASEELMRGRTVLLIAHRLHTVRTTAKIVVLAGGRVAEQGTHEALLARQDAYWQLLQEGSWERPPVVAGGRRAALPPPSERETESAFAGPEPRGDSQPLPRLLQLVAPSRWWLLLAVLLGALAVGSSIGLLGTSAYLISAAALQPSIADLNVAIVGVRFFGIARGLLRYLERLVSHSLTFRILARLRTWFYAALEPLAPARLLAYRSGDLLGRITSDVAILEDFYVRALGPPLVALVVAAGMVLFMARFDARLALLLLLFLFLAGVGLPALVLLSSRRPGRALVSLRSALQSQLVDGVQGMADLLAFGQERAAQEQLGRLGAALSRRQQRMSWIGGAQVALGELLANLAVWSVLLLAIPLVSAGQLAGVYLATLALATLAAFEAVQPLPLAAQQLERNLQAARRLFTLVDARPAVLDPPQPLRLPSAPALALHNLHFRYGPGTAPALRGISFDLPPGKQLAIVGASGAGKSTVLQLLLRFWPVEEGMITLNGRDIGHYAQDDLRRLYGVVTQAPHLFHTSLRENLRVARPEADDEALIAAARQAQLHDFIQSLPKGYDTVVGEEGRLLSGGQRQRLAMARAFLRDAPLLLLDEPTANLDPLTERLLLHTLFEFARGRTLLLLTHRLVGLEQMDEILVLDEGQVVERGRHAALLAQGGLYRQLWQLQQGAVG